MLQTANLRRFTLTTFRHLGALGLFFLAILDSSPVPTFGGPDLLIIILVTTRPNPWYEYASMAAAGSLIGAYMTYRLARKAGHIYLEHAFGGARVAAFMGYIKANGTGALIASTAIPFPFPTSLVFAAAGASEYGLIAFLSIVAVARGARYSAIAILAHRYGRRLSRILLHPAQYWGWFLALLVVTAIMAAAGFLLNRRILGARST